MKGIFALRKRDVLSDRSSSLSTVSAEPAKRPVAGAQVTATKVTATKDQRTRKQQVQQDQPLGAETAMSVARAKKIETIAKAVADGSYKVSSTAVADKVIDYMLEK